ncbi:ABC transporter substrate-binding protein [Paenibacillus xanthanilyticus]|uniref:ABC transporter substrate-binding protein n=1 Tax=Paenibacillus xanthanilyticus TaxID=1783531 RepID=A0ABV8KBJ4_9BACL
MKKKLQAALTVLPLALAVTACGGNDNVETDASKPEGQAAAKNVNLKFSFWGNDTHKKMYEDMFATYKETHPNVNVEIVTIPFADYQQKLSIMSASKSAPDIAWMAERMIPQFLSNGQLADLEPLKQDAAFKIEDMVPSTLNLVTRENKVYGIPFSTPPMMIYYNKTMFQANNLPTPTELYKQGKWTYEEMLKAAKALANPDKGIYGVNFVRSGWQNWPDAMQSHFNAFGAQLFNPEGNAFTLNAKEGEQALQVYSDMIFKDNVHPKPGDQTTFDTGKIAMQKELFSYMGKAKAVVDFEWDIAPLPAGPNGPGTTIGYASYTILKDSPHYAEALELLKYMANPENMKVTSQYFVPSRKSLLESDDFLKQGPSAESVKLSVVDQIATASSLPTHSNWQQIDTKMQTIMDYLYTQSTSVKDILGIAEKEVGPLLK